MLSTENIVQDENLINLFKSNLLLIFFINLILFKKAALFLLTRFHIEN